MAIKRSVIGTLLISLLVSQTILTDYNKVQSVYTTGVNPGMALRIE